MAQLQTPQQFGTLWGMLAASIAWNQSNDCKECNGSWRKRDFTLCECQLNAPFSYREIEGIASGRITPPPICAENTKK